MAAILLLTSVRYHNLLPCSRAICCQSCSIWAFSASRPVMLEASQPALVADVIAAADALA